MSYYILNYTKIKDFNFDNLIIGNKINNDQKYSKYYIYYKEDDITSELYIRLPKIRTIYNLSNLKYNSLKLPIYPEFEITNNIIEFIKNLENNIIDRFKKKKEFISLISKKESLQFIKMNIFDKINITSNTNQQITINDFKINSELEIVIKISYIWTNQLKFGLSSHIYQIKYWAPPEQLGINFIDTPLKIINSKPPNIINSQPIIIQPLIQNNVIIRPSLADLNNAIKSLRNTKKLE